MSLKYTGTDSVQQLQQQLREQLDILRSKTFDMTDKTVLKNSHQAISNILEKIPAVFDQPRSSTKTGARACDLKLRRKPKRKWKGKDNIIGTTEKK